MCVTGAYWFTASTSFANPAVTLARAFTNTFCGIAPEGVLPFVVAQVIGAALVHMLTRRITADPASRQVVRGLRSRWCVGSNLAR